MSDPLSVGTDGFLANATTGGGSNEGIIGTKTCGTGTGNFPQPGDPNLNSSILSAVPRDGGAFISWTYPGLLPHAVAHTRLYRGTVNDWTQATQIAIVNGSTFFDQHDLLVATYHYYWIKIISVNGTIGDLIGPASCLVPTKTQSYLEALEGEIGDSLLNQVLKARIDSITDISSGLSQEQQDRLLGDNLLNDAWANIQTDMDAVDTLIAAETLARIEGESAMVAQVNLILAKSNDNAAAIATESSVRASADSANASQITTLQTTVNGHTTSIQQLAIADSQFGALYGVKLDVNGYVAGFGLYNSGSSATFLINADKFAIGTPGATTSIPFAVANGEVYLRSAVIENGIMSSDWNPGVSGWGIFKDYYGFGGYAEFNNVRVRGDIEADSLKVNTLMVGEEHIFNGAVTAPAGNFKTTGVGLSTGSWPTVITTSTALTVPSGREVHVTVSYEVEKSGGTGDSYFKHRLYRVTNSAEALLFEVGSAQGFRVYNAESAMVAFTYKDTPAAGSHHYRLKVTRVDSGQATMSCENSAITAIGYKK